MREQAMSLPRPVGRQSHVIFLEGSGHQVILGTAGTGKTTMAMYRAENLAAPTTVNHGRVLLVTHNNALVTYLRYLRPESAENVTIETYCKFARGYLNSRGLMPRWGGIVTDRRPLVELAIKEIAAVNPSRFLERETAFFLDEVEWICGMGLRTLAEYQGADRIGRGTGLPDAQREIVWRILMTYRRLRAESGRRYDWADLASAVRTELSKDDRPRRYRHVVIDEGQDLSPEAVRSLVEAVDSAGSVTFFGDYHQMIYGQGMSWRSCGLKIRAVEHFSDNYRNTAEIARLAIALSQTPPMAGDPQDLVVPTEPTAAGPLPTLVTCASELQEIEIIRQQARDFARTGTVAVLARTWEDARRACGRLPTRRLHHDMRVWDATPGIYVGAYHSGKGLEFDAVLLPFCGASHMPHPDTVAAFGREEASAREARLLYVAITRARTDLLITHSGEVTPLLPPDDALYTRARP
jgi:superfamily I DNA/RNA helicase